MIKGTKLIACLYFFSLCNVYFQIAKSSENEEKNPALLLQGIKDTHYSFQLTACQIPSYIDYIEHIITGLKLAVKYRVPNIKLGIKNGILGLSIMNATFTLPEIVLLLKYPQLGISCIRSMQGNSKQEMPAVSEAEEKALTDIEKNELFELYKNENTTDSIKLAIGFLFLGSCIQEIKKTTDELKESENISSKVTHFFQMTALPDSFDSIYQVHNNIANKVAYLMGALEALKTCEEYEDILNKSNKLMELCEKATKRTNQLKNALLRYKKDSFSDFNKVYQELLKKVPEEAQKDRPTPLSPLTFEDQKPSTVLCLQKNLSLKDIEVTLDINYDEFLPKGLKKKVHKKPVKKKVLPKKKEKELEVAPKLKEEEIPAPLAANTIVIQDDIFNVMITLFKAKIEEQERPKVGPLEYTQSIKEWFKNPQRVLAKKMESMPKLKPGRKVEVTEERQIFLHAFSKKVDQYINECGKWKEFKNIRTKKKDYFIQMPAQVKRAEESPYLALVEYAVAERKGGSWLCYHRNLVEVSPQEFFTEWFGFDKAVIPAKIYQEEFPALKA